MARKRIFELATATDTAAKYGALDKSGNTAAEKVLWPHNIVATLPASPVVGLLYYLTTAATVYPKGLYMHDGTGWTCIQQLAAIALTAWANTALSLTLCSGVTYTVTATAAPTSLAIALTSIGSAIILKTGAFAIPEPTAGSKLTDTGLDALAETTNDVQIIIEKIGTTIIYSAAEVIAL